MRYRYNRRYRYRLTNPPKALLKARLDNIAIVPASMLPLTESLKEKVTDSSDVGCQGAFMDSSGQCLMKVLHTQGVRNTPPVL